MLLWPTAPRQFSACAPVRSWRLSMRFRPCGAIVIVGADALVAWITAPPDRARRPRWCGAGSGAIPAAGQEPAPRLGGWLVCWRQGRSGTKARSAWSPPTSRSGPSSIATERPAAPPPALPLRGGGEPLSGRRLLGLARHHRRHRRGRAGERAGPRWRQHRRRYARGRSRSGPLRRGAPRRHRLRHRAPRVSVRAIPTDNGSASRASNVRDACRRLGRRHRLARPYRPQTNVTAQRLIRTVLAEWADARAYPSSVARAAAVGP